MLRLERESALDPQHQGCGNHWRVGIALGGARRPLQLDRPGVARERFTDDGWPIGDQTCFTQAARGQRLGDQSGSEFSQRLGSASRALHHRRLGAESEGWGHEVDGMSANVSLSTSEAKRKATVGRTLAWWDRNRRALAWRAAPGETPDPYRVWLSEVLLQQTTTQAATPYYQAFVAKWPTVEDLAAGFRPKKPNYEACPALAPILRPRSQPSPSAAMWRPSTAILRESYAAC